MRSYKGFVLFAFLTLDGLNPSLDLNVMNVCKGPRLCENTCAVLKSALLRKIYQRLVYQQPENLRRNAIFARVLAAKPAQNVFTQPGSIAALLDRQETAKAVIALRFGSCPEAHALSSGNASNVNSSYNLHFILSAISNSRCQRWRISVEQSKRGSNSSARTF